MLNIGFWSIYPERKPAKVIYIMTIASRDKTSNTIQRMVAAAPGAEIYCTDRDGGYLNVVFLGQDIFNSCNKSYAFRVEGVDAALRHYSKRKTGRHLFLYGRMEKRGHRE